MTSYFASDFRSPISEVTAGYTGIVATITTITVTSIKTYFKVPNFGALTLIVTAAI